MYLRSFRFEPPFQDAYLPKIDVYEALNEERTEVIYTLQAAFGKYPIYCTHQLSHRSAD